MIYSEKLNTRIAATGSNLCVGIDPRPDQIEGDYESFVRGLAEETADYDHRHCAPQNQCDHGPSVSAQGHPDAYFASAPRHGEAHDAVKTDRRQAQRQRPECAQQ